MSTKAKYTKIIENDRLIFSGHLAHDSKKNIKYGLDFIKKLINTRKDDGAELKKECDYIFVGALIVAMAATDDRRCLELQLHAISGIDASFGDFLYPVPFSEVTRGSINVSLTGLDSYRYGLNFVGRRALETKDLPFTGSFNPACFPGLDDLFEAEHFNEYDLNTDPSTMIHCLTTFKAEVKIKQQARLVSELTALESALGTQLGSAQCRSKGTAKRPLYKLSSDLTILMMQLKNKLQEHNATIDDIDAFKREFKQIMDNPDYQTAMKAHRGQLIWRGVMDALLNIETWVRQLPSLVSQPTFSLASKDMFFSTKTAKVAGNIYEQVDKMSWQPPEV